MIRGINLGSGKWKKSGWSCFDIIKGDVLSEKTILPFDDSSIQYVFSSHFFEHVTDEVSQHLFNESYRILKPQGIFRIVVPDFEKFLNRYRERDINYFRQTIGFRGRPEWKKFGIEPTLENILLHWFSNCDNAEGTYRGPPKVEQKEVQKNAETMGVGEFSRWIVSQIPSNARGNHINWWNQEKAEQFFENAGFIKISLKSIGKSAAKEMTQPMFESKPNRSSFSLYMEATK